MKYLDKETETFEKNKEELLKSDKGKFVLIKGNDIIGSYDTELDAVNSGYEKFGEEEFLVKKIEIIEEKYNYANDLLILN